MIKKINFNEVFIILLLLASVLFLATVYYRDLLGVESYFGLGMVCGMCIILAIDRLSNIRREE